MAYADALSDAQLRAHDRPRDLIPAELWGQALSVLRSRLDPQGRVLEIGIGSGAYGGRLAATGAEVVGIDLNETMLRSAERWWAELRSLLVQADAIHVPIRDGGVDMVLIAQVLHLTPAWRQVLNEARRVLSSSGLLAVTGGGGVGRSGIGQYFRSVQETCPRCPEHRAGRRSQMPSQRSVQRGSNRSR